MKLFNKLFTMVLSTLTVLVFLGPGVIKAGEVLQANLGREGQNINPKSLIVPGRPVVVDFYSPNSAASLDMTSRLEQLATKSPLIVMKININRPGVQGVDFASPVSQQFGLKTLPYLVLLDPQGRMIAEGQKAMTTINQQLQEAGIGRGSGESPVQRAFGVPAAPPPAAAPARVEESSPPTMATVRKAKKAQGLKGYIFQDRNSHKFFLEDREGDSYKFEGGQWIKIGGQKHPEKPADNVEVQKQVKSQGQVIKADSSPPTITTVRKAKKAQGLNGYIFQDRNSKKFFLEDSEGSTYKFEGGQWIKID